MSGRVPILRGTALVKGQSYGNLWFLKQHKEHKVFFNLVCTRFMVPYLEEH